MMTARFKDFIPFIFKWEGGYDNDPDDPGGETHWGIDKRSHPEVDIKSLTQAGAQEIYWRDYWLKNGCEALPYPLGEAYFNCCVNCGTARARKIAGLAHDAKRFINEQEAFYRRLVTAKPALKKFLAGWLNRSEDLRKVLGVG